MEPQRPDLEVEERLLEHALEARRWLDQAADGLKRAGRWGWADFLGGGWFSSSRKHDNLDRVRSHLRRARRALRRLEEDAQALGLSQGRFDLGLDLQNDKWLRTQSERSKTASHREWNHPE